MTRGQLQALCEMLIKQLGVGAEEFRARFEECVQKVLNGS